MMAQMQNIIDFPPAPKLDASARVDPSRASEQELECELVFMGTGRCAVWGSQFSGPPHRRIMTGLGARASGERMIVLRQRRSVQLGSPLWAFGCVCQSPMEGRHGLTRDNDGRSRIAPIRGPGMCFGMLCAGVKVQCRLTSHVVFQKP